MAAVDILFLSFSSLKGFQVFFKREKGKGDLSGKSA